METLYKIRLLEPVYPHGVNTEFDVYAEGVKAIYAFKDDNIFGAFLKSEEGHVWETVLDEKPFDYSNYTSPTYMDDLRAHLKECTVPLKPVSWTSIPYATPIQGESLKSNYMMRVADTIDEEEIAKAFQLKMTEAINDLFIQQICPGQAMSLPVEAKFGSIYEPLNPVAFTDREVSMMAYCAAYAEEPCGLPGHDLMLLVAKLYEALHEAV